MSAVSAEQEAHGPLLPDQWIELDPKIRKEESTYLTYLDAQRVTLKWESLISCNKHIQIKNCTIANKFELAVAPPSQKKIPFGIRFVDVIFEEDVDLSEVKVYGPLMFWNCKFKKSADFSLIVVYKGVEVDHSLSAELNFSYSFFQESPTFERAQFDGTAFFHRTIFSRGANFDSAAFNAEVIFEGFDSDICVRTEDLKNVVSKALEKLSPGSTSEFPEAMFQEMQRLGIVLVNRDYTRDHFNFNPTYRSRESLEKSLDESHFLGNLDDDSRDAIKGAICDLWTARFEQKMFSGTSATSITLGDKVSRMFGLLRRMLTRMSVPPLRDAAVRKDANQPWRSHDEQNELDHARGVDPPTLAKFRNTQFRKRVEFRHIDLSPCLFMGAKVENAEFYSSKWARTSCNPLLAQIPIVGSFFAERSCLRDELELERELRTRSKPRPRAKPEPNRERKPGSKAPKNGRSTRDAREQEFSIRRNDLSELYRELRLVYDSEGDSLIGRDFYFGELEMERLSRTRWRRAFSVSGAYKLLAGYSCQEGLALSWLLFVFALSALGFSLIGRYEKSLIGVQTTGNVCEAQEKPQHGEEASAGSQNKLSAYLCPLKEDALQEVWGAGDTTSSTKVSKLIRFVDRIAVPLGASLQASTFFPSRTESPAVRRFAAALKKKDANDEQKRASVEISLAEALRHVLEGAERLAVLSQIGLVFLCLRSRFQRH